MNATSSEKIIFSVLRLELKAYNTSHSSSPFCDGFFRDRVLRTICPGWLRTTVLLISASSTVRSAQKEK
jgi:hypothetical protein